MSSASPHPARLRVGIVGAGRVGSVLGAALAGAGHMISGVSAVSEASRERAAALLPGAPIRTVDEVVAEADFVLFAVPDDSLSSLLSGLVTTGALRPGQIVAHTSGLHGLDVFDAAITTGIHPLALHPAMTFTGTDLDLARLADCCFGITTAHDLRPIAEALVIEIGAEPVWIEPEQRATYHLGLAHGANHLTTLIAQAMEILSAAGVAQPARMIGPLVQAALDNTLRSGDAALTGPVARGDVGTVERHMDALAPLAPDIAPAYRAMALATVRRAQRDRRLRPDQADPLTDLLEGSP